MFLYRMVNFGASLIQTKNNQIIRKALLKCHLSLHSSNAVFTRPHSTESSFFTRYDEDESKLRPFPSWFGGLDMSSVTHLYRPTNPISDSDIDKLLDIENEGFRGWRRIKKSRELEIWRKEGKGPLTIKVSLSRLKSGKYIGLCFVEIASWTNMFTICFLG